MPESRLHDIAIEYLRAVLLAWAERERRDVEIARNLGIHWFEPERRAGFDPDLCLLEPKPPDVESIGSLRLWEPGHVPPWLAIEIVSPGHPYKDYVDTPDRCAAAGVGELWVYDPQLKGPKRLGGPYLLQIWSRDTHGSLVRSHAGDGPAYSPVMNAWLHPIASKNASEAKLRLSDARDADVFWPTLRETHERQRLESERQTAELLRRIAELESERASREG